jgi:NTP pyrophosphatase (non-canonical NTP hydrolase)
MEMTTLDKIFEEVWRIEGKAEVTHPQTQTVENSVLKMMEELGEIAEGVLSLNGYKKKAEDMFAAVNENLDEECVDLMIMSMVFAKKRKLTIERLAPIFEKKFAKWQRKYVK